MSISDLGNMCEIFKCFMLVLQLFASSSCHITAHIECISDILVT